MAIRLEIRYNAWEGKKLEIILNHFLGALEMNDLGQSNFSIPEQDREQLNRLTDSVCVGAGVLVEASVKYRQDITHFSNPCLSYQDEVSGCQTFKRRRFSAWTWVHLVGT